MAALALVSGRVAAHAIGLSTGEYALRGESVVVKLAFARAEVASVLPRLDENRDGHVTAFEVESAKKELEAKVLARIHVTSRGAACASALVGVSLTEQDGLSLDARFDCASGGGASVPFEIDVALLDDLSRGHRHVARAIGATTHDEILTSDHSSFSITPAAPPASDAARPPPAAPGRASSAWAFFRMGIDHILARPYDHLVFLFGLVLLRARIKELLAIVTAFTVAHSVTLALAVFGLLTPSPRFVEPAIALSIVYVGIENFFVKDASKRWRITFPFGLIHGFGFAAALQDVRVPRPQIPVALVSFNVGVEAGQLFALALVLPLVVLVRRQVWFEPSGVRLLSGAVALAGGIWFVARIVSGGGG
jgi:hydrogenase/urease accessory protein HupE